jgi:hypothetical protein
MVGPDGLVPEILVLFAEMLISCGLRLSLT